MCREAGAEVKPIDLPIAVKYGVATYYVTALADASSKLGCYDGIRYGTHVEGATLADMYANTRTASFSEEVRRRIILGTCLLTEGFYQNYYGPALKVRTKMAEEFEGVFEKYDAYLLPTTPSLPYILGTKETDPNRMYLGGTQPEHGTQRRRTAAVSADRGAEIRRLESSRRRRRA